MPVVRRLDHVAIGVRDSDRAAADLCARLGLQVIATEEVSRLHVRLTYLDAGNCYLQLVEPLDPSSQLGRWLEEHGEGVHHVCFGVDSVPAAITRISGRHVSVELGSGRGRASAFVPDPILGTRFECTEFSRQEDVEAMPGWLTG